MLPRTSPTAVASGPRRRAYPRSAKRETAACQVPAPIERIIRDHFQCSAFGKSDGEDERWQLARSPRTQADFVSGAGNGMTLPHCSGGIHFATLRNPAGK